MPLINPLENKVYVLIQSFFFGYLFKDIKYLFLMAFRKGKKLDMSNKNFYLPKKVKKFSVVRSPTMSKLSKEQFEFRFFKVCLMFSFSTYLDFLVFKSSIMYFDLKYSYFKFSTYSNLNYDNQ
jgi:hypothetical protein